jgi:hypothetical protein
MIAAYILGAVGLLFLVLGGSRVATPTGRPQARVWLLIGAIFVIVAAWLLLNNK